MRKVFTLLTGIFFTFLFTSCEQFTSDIDTYLGYWAAEIAPVSYSIDQLQKPYPTNKDDVLCIPSTSDVTVTINLRNPKNFTLVMPNSPSLDAGKVITFPGLSPQPEYGELKDYTLTQTANDKLELKYKSTFLQAHEWGNGNISPEITFITGRRVFRRKFNLNLKVDTAPALEYAGIGKTTVGTDNYYVLLFRVKGMNTPITDSSVHKDIKKLIVTAGGGSPVEIPLTFNTGKTDFVASADLLASADVVSLDSSSLPSPTAQDWILRLKTDVKVDGHEKAYRVSIKDAQGVSSTVISAGTPKNKLADVELLDGFTPMAETPTSPGVSEANPKVFAGMSVKTLTAKAQSGAAITGAIYKKNGSAWTETDTVSGITPVTVNLPALGTGETEALYKITLKARLSGYDDSDKKTFFVKLLRQELPVLKIKQDFSSSGQSFHKNISTATKGYVNEDIIPDAGNYNTATTPLVIYNLNGGAAFLIAPRTGSGATVKYQLNTDPEHSATMEAPITLPNAPTHTLQVWAVKNGIEGPKTTLHIKVIKAITTYSELKNVVQNAPAGNEIRINIDNDITAPSDIGNTEIAVTGGKKLIALPKPGDSSHIINAAGKGRIFNISGSGTELTLEDIKLEGGNAGDGKGGAAYVETGGILVLKGKTVITPSIGSEVNTPGKNDVYLDITKSSSIKVDGALTSTEPIVARITPVPYSDTHRVLTGTAVGSEYIKFSVTQTFDSTNLWKIKNDGKLEAIPSVINGSDSLAWQKLKNAVQNFPNGSIITINGEIKATNEGSGPTANYGEIVINKNLTIKGKTGAASDILNANGTTTDPNAPPMKHRIFKVTSGKMLTLENLTLKNGKAEGTAPADCGGAIYTDGGTINITNCTITGSEAGNGGAVYARQNSTIMMSGGKICANKASSFGGGMYIYTSTLKLTNNALIGGEQYYADSAPNKIKGNIAENGGGIYFASTGNKTFKMENSTISFNTAEAALPNNNSGGGGVTLGSNIEFTMKGGAIKNNKAVSMSGSVSGGGIALGNSNSKFIMESGNPEISENKAESTSGSASGGGVYVALGATLDIKSGNITGNDAKQGRGVYVSSPSNMRMSGSAKIDTNNDVYLGGSPSNAKIKLDGALTGTTPVACITVPNNKYNTSTQVLDGDITDGTPQNYTKFIVTQQTTPAQEWKVGNDGKLIRK
ncbi:right-handed parallel beta-helix repeat-containing protein [Treponema sp. OMZ 857]|uniref:right-handed parallel beta-helix repeat-containing protein n=1 Tax=Treponema sp. OMZ 857 TaxID=1643513 RepID=UPI0020A39EC1|nr:right-handed parallel beta-helix repeat-containing protein [Treponema sp. OMZ 857]UTC42674.1 right-handed parallel beta-helix repeat-containing protein [Treponema sp. OMZ 857]